jgi:hypothetical protein
MVTFVDFFWSDADAFPVTGTPVCHAPPFPSTRRLARVRRATVAAKTRNDVMREECIGDG